MKKYFLITICLLLLGGCGQEKETETPSTLRISVDLLKLNNTAQDTTFSISASGSWVITGAEQWCRVSVSEGEGDRDVVVSVDANESEAELKAVLTISMGDKSEQLVVCQEGAETDDVLPYSPVPTSPEMNAMNLPLYTSFAWTMTDGANTNEMSYVISWSTDQENWVHSDELHVMKYITTDPLAANTKYFWKVTAMDADGRRSESRTYSFFTGTTRYTEGYVLTLEKNKDENPVNLVFMGDGFIREDYDDGTFESVMREAVEGFFSRPPYTTYRSYFNLYSVVAFSHERGASDQSTKKNTAFNTKYTGDHVSGSLTADLDKAYQYAQSVPAVTNICETTVILVVNADRHAGSTLMETDGRAVSICPRTKGVPGRGGFADLIAHEAGGHGFGMLADEYMDRGGELPESEKAVIVRFQNAGWFQNLSLTNDPQKVSWRHFIGLAGYESTSIVEGGFYYTQGVWRPQINSCMIYNNFPYNAPSREAIVKRIFSIAKEDYSFEKFLEKDIP